MFSHPLLKRSFWKSSTLTQVNRIRPELQKPGYRVKKGEEVGLFQFGGSSIIVAFEKGRIKFDDDLATMSNRKIMVDVEVGMSMGRVPPKRA